MLDFDYTLLIQFFNFLILLILLNVLLFKPVLRAIDKRQNTLGALLGRATGVKEDVNRLEKAYDEGSRDRRKPVLDGKESALAEAHKASIHLIEQARSKLSEELAQLKGDVERESRAITDTLRADVDRLSAEVAEKILKRSL